MRVASVGTWDECASGHGVVFLLRSARTGNDTIVGCVGYSAACGCGALLASTSAKVRPSLSSVACWPVKACQRRIATSTYLRRQFDSMACPAGHLGGDEGACRIPRTVRTRPGRGCCCSRSGASCTRRAFGCVAGVLAIVALHELRCQRLRRLSWGRARLSGPLTLSDSSTSMASCWLVVVAAADDECWPLSQMICAGARSRASNRLSVTSAHCSEPRTHEVQPRASGVAARQSMAVA